MIRISIRTKCPDITGMQISGHADSAPHGKDLVCCAVSAVAISGLNALDEMFGRQCSLEMGKKIRIKVIQNSEGLQSCLRMLAYQLYSLAEANPDFISADVDGKKLKIKQEEKEV